MHPIVLGNIEVLQQLIDILNRIEQSHYAEPICAAVESPIGKHIRHILDHYTAVRRVESLGKIDYDLRSRQSQIERDKQVALEALMAVRDWLQALDSDDLDAVTEVKTEVMLSSQQSTTVTSSCGRELIYASAHAIHHQALIAVALRIAGLDVSQSFGLAPATATWEREQALAS